ncbi:hypothetical protein HPB51_002760 [Rhipicephalus microplus]|uniref:Uncharacterized protein n=1 Tax=Rhipicephalus microplus TaxID=6941 RepID=A0A9J6EWP6_RHIMP|nr:hypothetical protein HPB51_002760 [Rhipicephalus microplus]
MVPTHRIQRSLNMEAAVPPIPLKQRRLIGPFLRPVNYDASVDLTAVNGSAVEGAVAQATEAVSVAQAVTVKSITESWISVAKAIYKAWSMVYGGHRSFGTAGLEMACSRRFTVSVTMPYEMHGWRTNRIRAIVFLTLATCAFAGYAGYLGYSIAAPAYTAYHVPLASVSAVHHAPAFGYDLGYSLGCGVPAYGYGLGSYGLSYGYGFGGLGYSTLFRKKWELLSQ